MQRALRFAETLLVSLIVFFGTAIGQSDTTAAASSPPQPTPLKYDCSKEKDPFASYCDGANKFLLVAAAHVDAKGKVDRKNTDVTGAIKPLLDVSSVAGLGGDPTRFTALRASDIALQDALGKISSGVSQNRQDQQTSATMKSSGTTGLVSKPGAPAILAFALESGALIQSVSGNTGTFSGNADGLYRVLTGQQVLCFSCPGAMGSPILRSLNLSATFLIDQHSSSAISTTGTANASTPTEVTSVTIPTSTGKLSSITARYQLRNPFDPRDPKFREAWNRAVNSAKQQIDEKAKALQDDLVKLLVGSPAKKDPEFQKLTERYADVLCDDVDGGDLAALRRHFLELYETTVAIVSKDDPQFNEKAANVNLSLAQYKALWQQLLDDARGQPILTFEYSFNRPVNQPETHDFRMVYGRAPKSGVGLFSINAAVSIYGGTLPVGAKYGRLHDGQIAAQFDRPIAMHGNPTQATLTLAGYWQYQPDPSVLNITAGNLVPGTNIDLPGNAQVLLGTAGSLWVTQAKFTVNGKSGIKVPFAVKWSNKTDLLSGTRIGAQVGISYDFSSISSLFGGGL
jgi:hypothetical protein